VFNIQLLLDGSGSVGENNVGSSVVSGVFKLFKLLLF